MPFSARGKLHSLLSIVSLVTWCIFMALFTVDYFHHSDNLIVQVRTDQNIPLLNLLEEHDNVAVSAKLQNVMTYVMVSLFDIASTAMLPRQSTEQHKEQEDNHVLKKLLVAPTPVVFADEVCFEPISFGPRGKFDLLIGHYSHAITSESGSGPPPIDSAILVLHAAEETTTKLSEPVIAEAKQSSCALGI